MTPITQTRRASVSVALFGSVTVVVLFLAAFAYFRYGSPPSAQDPVPVGPREDINGQGDSRTVRSNRNDERTAPPNRPGGQGVIDSNIDASVTLPNEPQSESRNENLTNGVFEARFAQLADAADWDGLARLIRDAIRSADPLDEFLPILWACLESVEWRATYQPVGQAVQAGLIGRSDLKQHRDTLNNAFLSSESPLVITAIAGPVVAANGAGGNPALKMKVEKLLVHREVYLKGTRSFVVRSSFEGMLIAAHTGHSASVLESIEFVQSLRATGLSVQEYVSFWEYSVVSSLYHRHYTAGDVAAIIRHLVDFSHERLAAESGRAEGLAGLKKIWSEFREDAALAAIEAASAAATDQALRDAWDDIAVAWLAKKK